MTRNVMWLAPSGIITKVVWSSILTRMVSATIQISLVVSLITLSLASCSSPAAMRQYEYNEKMLRIGYYLLPYDSSSVSEKAALYFYRDQLIFISDRKGWSITPPSLITIDLLTKSTH
jgi:hypothetical protein